MKILVTGSSGHLGEALVRTLRDLQYEVIGLDILESPFTTHVGSISDRSRVRRCMSGVQAVFHAATLHKPHVATHSRQDFIDTNVTGTLNLLEEATAAGVESFVYTSTTSVFGHALAPPPEAPAAWITEEVTPVPRNIYGVTKAAAEDLCELFHRNQGLACIVLRTSRFFPEDDDNRKVRKRIFRRRMPRPMNISTGESTSKMLSAHICWPRNAQPRSVSANTSSAQPRHFGPDDLAALRVNAPQVVRQRVPDYEAEYDRRQWKMLPSIDRVYVNERARNELGWRPQYDFQLRPQSTESRR